MNDKKNSMFTSLIILFILITFAVADVSRNNPGAENFVSERKWQRIQARFELILGKKELQEVYLGKDGYLFAKYTPSRQTLSTVWQRIDKLEKLTDEWNANVMLVPSADNILKRKLPDNAPYYDETDLLDRVYQMVGEEHYVDVYSALNEHLDEYIYYKTDEHWTALGAFYAYPAWAETAAKPRFPYDIHDAQTLANRCRGELQSEISIPWGEDTITYFPETERRLTAVTYDFLTQTDTMYNGKWPGEGNPYGFFMDDEHVFTTIKSNRKNGRTLFVLKDSYADCFLPFLLPHYETIYVLELRGYKDNLNDFMRRFGNPGEMEVLVLYNVRNFMEEFDYQEVTIR